MCLSKNYTTMSQKCKTMFSLVKLSIQTKKSAKVWFPMSSVGLAVAVGFSNWPFEIWFQNFGRTSILGKLVGASCSILSYSVLAIALSNVLESSRAYFIGPFPKFRATICFSCSRSTTTFKDSCIKKLLALWSLKSLSSVWEAFIVRMEFCQFHYE